MTNNTEAKDLVVSVDAPSVRRRMVTIKAQRLIERYEKALTDILKRNESETSVTLPMSVVQEIIGTPLLHDEVMEMVEMAFITQGLFRTSKTSGRLVYPTSRIKCSHEEHVIATLTLHW